MGLDTGKLSGVVEANVWIGDETRWDCEAMMDTDDGDACNDGMEEANNKDELEVIAEDNALNGVAEVKSSKEDDERYGCEASLVIEDGDINNDCEAKVEEEDMNEGALEVEPDTDDTRLDCGTTTDK